MPLWKQSKYDEALKAYDKAIEINPQDSKMLGTIKDMLFLNKVNMMKH